MALTAKSLFLYNYQVTPNNSSIDFQAMNAGPVIQATLNVGFYSLSSLLIEIARAMGAADPNNLYTATADRTIAGGLQNRVTISTNGAFLSILFGSGPRVGSSIAPYIGFNTVDQVGALTYTGTQTSGTTLIPSEVGFNYSGAEFNQKVFGNVNVSASGQKEAIVFAIQQFIQVQYLRETQLNWILYWLPMVQWMIQQREFDFTPEISSPDVFYEVSLEQTEADGQGLAFMPTEMLPEFPNNWDTGLMKFRLVPS
jgi:hypothetical protein